MCMTSDPLARAALSKEPGQNATGFQRAINGAVLRIGEKNAVDPLGNKIKREYSGGPAPVQNVVGQVQGYQGGSLSIPGQGRASGPSRLTIGAAQ